jgi:hypothetical protein
MAAELKHQWTSYNPYQAPGTATWTWPVGENQHYWGYSVRPYQFNSHAEVLRQWSSSNNFGTWTEGFEVRTDTGTLLRFSAIAVIGA